MLAVESSYHYLGGDALHTGIYVDLIRRLEDEGLVVGLVTRLRLSPNPLATWRAWRDRDFLGPNWIETVRGSIRGHVHQVPVWNLLPGLSAPTLARTLGLPDQGDRRVVVHTRQIVMARLALALKQRWPGLRVISELEGDDLAEVQYKRSKTAHPTPWLRLLWTLERDYYERAERRILIESDAVICVSRKLREVMVHRYALTPQQVERVHVIPTLASRKEFSFDPDRRERTRRALGLQDRFVVVYSGNLRARWQVPERLVEAFIAVRRIRPTACFLVLTQEADRRQLEPLLRRTAISPDDYRVLSCRHGEVVNHLCAADVGLLLRDRHPMNEVAAPGKFAEYVLSGLPIVMTEGIGDFSAPLRESEFACVLPDLGDADDCRERIQRFCARDFAPEQRSAFSVWAAERFAVELSTPRLADLYRTV
jgi:glycosyltransferase involved in cell wall biosynthesis